MKLKRIIKWLDGWHRKRRLREIQDERQRHRECIDRWIARDVSLLNKRVSQAQLEKAKKREEQWIQKKFRELDTQLAELEEGIRNSIFFRSKEELMAKRIADEVVKQLKKDAA